MTKQKIKFAKTSFPFLTVKRYKTNLQGVTMKRFNSIEIHIDAENVSSKKIGSVINRVSKYGDIRVKHCYADFSNPSVKPWLLASNEYSITPIQATNIVTGKNTSDLELVKDCVMSMARGKADLMVLITSDSDFTSTVRELREAGVYTIGVGERKTPRPLQNAYNEFWFLDEFVSNTETKPNKQKTNNNIGKRKPVEKQQVCKPKTLEDIVVREIQKLQQKFRKNWILVSLLGSELKNRGIEFNVGLNDFVREHEKFILTKDKTTDAWLVTVNKEYCSKNLGK